MTAPPSKKSRKGLIALVVIVIAAVVLAIPPVLAGGLYVPVSKVVFGEKTGSLFAGNASATVSTVTAYEYYFSIRTGGMVRTSDTSVSSSSGSSVNVTISLTLTNPSGTTVDLGKTNISGGIGTRSHTIYLSVDQGVRVSGTYTLAIVISVQVSVGGVLEVGISPVTLNVTFSVS
ncbi:MAG TPA: hypothetical protein VFE96_01745 [Candidatus Bathyarchaeia archaeon]|jgi:hypothetical protein|nr:hypothetical protein [Candidatus Bathyarchaeia archaeon]